MHVNSIGIIGYGHFGQFIETLAHRFLPEVKVRVYSRRGAPGEGPFCTLEETASCDVVVLCGGISEYKEQLSGILPHVAPATVLVDVATVKKYPTIIFQEVAADRRWVSCHPMFGPESYKKTNENVSGYRIVVTDYSLVSDDFLQVKNFFAELGFVVIEMSADEHDKLLAETLFLTHYIAQSVSGAGFARTAIDTVSFQSLMNAVESVVHDKKLFQDVYRFNPYCQEVAKRFYEAQERVFGELTQH